MKGGTNLARFFLVTLCVYRLKSEKFLRCVCGWLHGGCGLAARAAVPAPVPRSVSPATRFL